MDENRTYTTVQGDMWDAVAYRIYGDVKYISLLLAANPDLLDIYVFSAGTKIILPELPEEYEDEIPEWRK